MDPDLLAEYARGFQTPSYDASLDIELQIGDNRIKRAFGLNAEGGTHSRQNDLQPPVEELSWDAYVSQRQLTLLDIHTWNNEGKRVQLVLLKDSYNDGEHYCEEKDVEVDGKTIHVAVDFTFHVIEKK